MIKSRMGRLLEYFNDEKGSFVKKDFFFEKLKLNKKKNQVDFCDALVA